MTSSLRDAPRGADLALNLFDHPIIFATPRRLPEVSAWREHIPFAMLLVDILRPAALVELGTHYGLSYCAFCQAVDELRLPTSCYAVDTWEGDHQSGSYGPEVLAELRAHHDPLYGHFSRLIQSTFDEAVEHFADATVDLLHLDGLHTYEASRHDFETWLPKVSTRGVVLLHDINSRERDFGVWRLWEELRGSYPHLELLHAHGLGVLGVGMDQSDAMRALFALEGDALNAFRELLFQLGFRFKLQLQLQRARATAREEHGRLKRKLKEAREVAQTLEENLELARVRADEAQVELSSYSDSPLARAGRRIDQFRRRRGRR